MQVLSQVRYDDEVVDLAHLKCFDYRAAVAPSVGSWPWGPVGSRFKASIEHGLWTGEVQGTKPLRASDPVAACVCVCVHV